MIKKLLYNLNIIKKNHFVQPFVYIGNSLKPTWHMTDKIKWLDKPICIKCKKKDYLDKLRELEEKYETIDNGKYRGCINFY